MFPSTLLIRLRALPAIAADGLLAVALMASAWFVAGQDGRLSLLHAVTIALITAPAALRRRYPVAVNWAIGLALLANLALGFANSFFETFAIVVAIYTMFAAAHWGRLMALTVAVEWIGLHVSFAVDWHNHGHVNLADLPYNYILLVVPAVLGYSVRTRRAYIGQLEADSKLLVREAAAAERTRIARELHDVVAHSVSVMVLQATAGGRLARRDPTQAAGAFEVIEQTGRNALSDLRRLVGVLRTDRDDVADHEPQPGLDQLQALLDQVRSAGMTVALSVRGEPRPLPAAVELSAYRIVQESLTNVLKHANAGHAEVAVTYAQGALRLEIFDDGTGSADSPAGGNGLTGIRERVRMFGGEFDAGRAERGFRVRASLPLEPTVM